MISIHNILPNLNMRKYINLWRRNSMIVQITSPKGKLVDPKLLLSKTKSKTRQKTKGIQWVEVLHCQ